MEKQMEKIMQHEMESWFFSGENQVIAYKQLISQCSIVTTPEPSSIFMYLAS